MPGYITRKIEGALVGDLHNFPAVALLGPRQSGKSTLAKHLPSYFENFLYLDLESENDLRKLNDPEFFFEIHKDKLICIDEIQRRPDLFPVLRSILDKTQKSGQLVILGSASRDLIKQSSETLAGRISYLELTPFILSEVNNEIQKNWLRGGFPDSFLKKNEKYSYRWRNNFIRTYLERDIPSLGINITGQKLKRLWTMCAHNHGQVLNSSKLGDSLGISYHTVRSYIDLLEQTFTVRTLMPYYSNIKKRIVKSPKLYIRDSGILHTLLDIETFDSLMGHPVFGASWEGFAIENILTELSDWKGYFYRTASGIEIDLVLEKGLKKIAVELKTTSAPVLSKGFWTALTDLQVDEAWIVTPFSDIYKMKKNVTVTTIPHFLEQIKKKNWG